MSKLLAVFGATGQQGGSVITNVLNDPELSQKYKLRAITRDINSDKAKQLSEKVEVVKGDASDPASLETALTGVNTVFAMTTPDFGPNGLEVEYTHGKTIADVAVAKGAEYIIFSTLPAINDLSRGKYTKCNHFDAKAKAEAYIRKLPIKSAFISPGIFMENYHSYPFMNPQKAADGTYVLARPVSPKSRAPYIDAVGDTGKFIGAILAEPEKYAGKTFCAGTTQYSWEEVAAVLSKATGKNIINKQVSAEEFAASMPFAGDIFAEVFSFGEEAGGFYGPESEELVAWAAKNARGTLSTLWQYLEKHPLELA